VRENEINYKIDISYTTTRIHIYLII